MQFFLKSIFSILFSCMFLMTFAQNYQEYFTIQVGTFVHTQINDFDAIRPYGLVYGEEVQDNTYKVYIGGYDTENDAQRVLVIVKQKGYLDAFVMPLPMNMGKAISVVQLDTKSIGEKINWAKYLNVGRIHTVIQDNTIKIMSGTYASIDAAQIRLERAQMMGFAGAFPKRINSMLLHKVTTFDTNGLVPNDTELVAVANIPNDIPVAAEQLTSRGNHTECAVVEPVSEYAMEGTFVVVPKGGDTSAEMPSINAKSKRQSVEWLQILLAEEGAYRGDIDGYYGDATKRALSAVKVSNYQLQKYTALMLLQEYDVTGDFRDWDDIRWLATIANDMTPNSKATSGIDLNILYNPPRALNKNEYNQIVSWDYRFRRGLDIWAAADPLHPDMARALKIAYLQSQVRLEDFYMAKGYSTTAAKGLALHTLYTLVGNRLERFEQL